jgi:hypothetical protein
MMQYYTQIITIRQDSNRLGIVLFIDTCHLIEFIDRSMCCIDLEKSITRVNERFNDIDNMPIVSRAHNSDDTQ